MISPVSEAMITGENGRRLLLERVTEPDDERIWSYAARLELADGGAGVVLYDGGDGLARFFRDLASAWGGFEGVRRFGSLEGNLSIEARHDGVGTVFLDVCVGSSSLPEWALSAEIDLGAGAHLDRIAGDLEVFCG